MQIKVATILSLLLISFSTLKGQSNFIGSGVTLKFNGNSNNYVNLGDVFSSLDFPFSFEAWINPESYPPGYGGIFGSDNDQVIYHGFWVRLRPDETIEIEFGDGVGSGDQFRRGFKSLATVPLNQWMHLAVTCASDTTVHIYFNGVDQALTPTDGGSTILQFTHSTSPATIGRTINAFGESDFKGQIDEVRLWNELRTQSDIRDFMCKKLDSSSPGLIGYWVSDESYSSITVKDLTIPAENGTISGAVTKLTSGAPIGDKSAYKYLSIWNGVNIAIKHASDDSLVTNDISGNPYGVQVYIVDSFPHDTLGLDTVPQFYFGVFCAQSGSIGGYDATYHYNYNDGVIVPNNEATAVLFRRNDGSASTWSNSYSALDMINNNLLVNNESKRGEYILDVKAFHGTAISSADSAVCEKFCIDFFDQSTNNPSSWQWIFDGGNPSTSNQQNPSQVCYNTPGVYDVTLITSNINGTDTLTLNNYITVYSTPAAPSITQAGNTLTSSNSFSYQWQLNSVDIPGATNQSYNIMQTGYYTVVVENENGCDNSATVYILIEGIDEVKFGNTLVFPNPAIDEINIKLSGISEPISKFRITDLEGKTLKELNDSCPTQSVSISVSDLSNGFYFVDVLTSSGWRIGKFEIQK